jgi:exodeoxyribonuclease III
VKCICFNINGVRARLHQLQAIIDKHQPDVIGLQETKVHDEAFPVEAIQAMGYHVEFHGQKAHYGVALLSKVAPTSVYKGFSTDTEEDQKRLISAEYEVNGESWFISNGYFPQGESRDHPTKFPAKQKFYSDLNLFIAEHGLVEKRAIIMGDMNISHQDIDIGIGEPNRKRWLKTGKCSFLPEEREWLNDLLGLGWTDTFRHLYPTTDDRFSWFDYRSRGFDDTPKRGLRIDLILASELAMNKLVESEIDYELRGIEKPSDHAPIFGEFK